MRMVMGNGGVKPSDFEKKEKKEVELPVCGPVEEVEGAVVHAVNSYQYNKELIGFYIGAYKKKEIDKKELIGYLKEAWFWVYIGDITGNVPEYRDLRLMFEGVLNRLGE